MNNTSKVLSLIERTNNLKTHPKNVTPNTTTTSIITTDHSPSPRIKKPQSLSISEPIVKSPNFKVPNSTKNQSHQPHKDTPKGLSRSSIEFIKNMNFSLSELSQINEKSAKNQKELSSQEQKTLKYIKHLLYEQKKNYQPIHKGKIENFDQNIKIFTQEAAEEICLLEKKCEELEEQNKALELLMYQRHSEEQNEKFKSEKNYSLKSVKEIFKMLKTEFQVKDKSEFEILLKPKINTAYSDSIENLVSTWSRHRSPDQQTLHSLVNLILKVEQKLLAHKSSITDSHLTLLTKRQNIEHLLSKTKKF